MPPEEPHCLVALNMETRGENETISGERVVASENHATVSWYTSSSDPPSGYQSILDGLLFVRSATIGSRAYIDRFIPTKIDSNYQWKDTAQNDLMIAVALPLGRSIVHCNYQIEEAKSFGHRVAVYWFFPGTASQDPRITLTFSLERCYGSVDEAVERLNRAVVFSRARPATAHYDVALSFAGEDRNYAEAVAEALISKGVKVFYDHFEEASLWGTNLYDRLGEIYGRLARFTVMFVSSSYAAKQWTTHERKAAQAKAFTQNSEYILPVRFDDTEIPGMLPTTGYIMASKKTPEQLAELIISKLNLPPTA